MPSAAAEIVGYVLARRSRTARHGSIRGAVAEDVTAVVDTLGRDGCAVLRGVFPPDQVDEVYRQADSAVRAGGLVPARVRKPFAEQVVSAEDALLLQRLARRGEDELGRRESMVYIADVLDACPAAVPLLFDDIVLDIAAGYYGCPTALISPKIVRSYANDLPETTVNRFHCDYQRVPFLKFFVYLTDVESVDDGPFCYVPGSHRRKPRGWRKHAPVWSEQEIVDHYGPRGIRMMTARRGDLVVADTRGFHRGVKPSARNRTMLKVSTGLRPWSGTSALLPAETARTMTPKQLAAAEFLDIR